MAFSPGDYSDWCKLAEGGEAEVFRARQVSLDRLAAIKRLKLSAIGSEAEVRRFEGEARLYASLSHPSLVQVYDYGRHSGYYHLVMEYVPGADLGRLIAAERAGAGAGLPLTVKLHLARQMAEVVGFLHGRGVLHRDIKPENFMVDPAGRVKLLDLGLAWERGRAAKRGKSEPLKGTLAYMAPETFKGAAADAASELYSLAVVLLELFAGRRLAEGRPADELLALIQEGTLAASALPDAPPAVRALLAPCLQADPALRPRSLEPLIGGLKALQGGSLRLAAGAEALQAALRKETKAWLWSLVRAAEAPDAGRPGRAGAQPPPARLEEAFARLKELLEHDPDDAEAQAKLSELGRRLNDEPPAGAAGRARTRRVSLAAAACAILAAAAALIFYILGRSGEDLGNDLMERELSMLTRESEALPGPKPARSASRPYGVLIVEGLPREYRVLVNRTRYPGGGEIHLPASRYLLEIQDSVARPVLRDSVTVGGGEPTVYRFAGAPSKGMEP